MVELNSILISLLPFIFCLGQLTRIPLGLSGVNLYFYDLVIGVLVISYLFKARFKLTQLPLKKPIQIFWLVSLLSLVLARRFLVWNQLLVASLYWLRWLVYSLMYWVLKAQFKRDKQLGLRWPKLWLMAILIFSGLGLIQYFVWPDLSQLIPLGWDEHYFRLTSTFLDPNFAGLLLVLGILLSLKLQLWAFPALLVSLLLTYSRSSYLALIIGLSYWGSKQRRIKVLAIILVVFGLGLWLLPRPFGEGGDLARTSSGYSRLNNWRQSLELVKQRPIFGYGFNSLRYVQSATAESHAGAGIDASLLTVLTTTGIVGLISYGYLLLKMWSKGSLIFRAGLLAIFIHSFFNNSLFYPVMMFWLWSFIIVWE